MPNQRAENKRQVTAWLDEDLVEKIDQMAADENRKRANMIATILQREVELAEQRRVFINESSDSEHVSDEEVINATRKKQQSTVRKNASSNIPNTTKAIP